MECHKECCPDEGKVSWINNNNNNKECLIPRSSTVGFGWCLFSFQISPHTIMIFYCMQVARIQFNVRNIKHFTFRKSHYDIRGFDGLTWFFAKIHCIIWRIPQYWGRRNSRWSWKNGTPYCALICTSR